MQTNRMRVFIASEIGSRFAISTPDSKTGSLVLAPLRERRHSSSLPSHERNDIAPSVRTEKPLLQCSELVAQLRGLLEFQVLRVLEHLLLEPLDLFRERLLRHRVVARLLLGGLERLARLLRI